MAAKKRIDPNRTATILKAEHRGTVPVSGGAFGAARAVALLSPEQAAKPVDEIEDAI